MSRRSSTSSTSSRPFEDALEKHEEHIAPTRFSPEEEANLLSESHAVKSDANTLFATGEFSQAISVYDRALASCPNYLDYEVAVLKSNIAACHVKLEDWKAAVESATAGVECLDRVEGKEKKGKEKEPASDKGGTANDASSEKDTGNNDVIVELDEDEDETQQLHVLQLLDKRKEEVGKLRTKILLRRAKANMEQGGWATLAAAETDYRELMASSYLPERDKKFVRAQLAVLPSRLEEAKQNEMGEMMGKLKDLGNGLLKPFGLSTDMFNMVKDEKTGGYSMSFGSGGSSGGS